MPLLTLSVLPAAERGQVGRILPRILRRRASVLREMSKEVSEYQQHTGQILSRRVMIHRTCSAYIHATLLSFISI